MGPKCKITCGGGPKFKVPKSATKTDSNRYQVFSDMEDDICSIEKGKNIEERVKIPPIIVDHVHSFMEIIKFLGSCSNIKFKKMSIGTKVMPNTLIDYDEVKIQFQIFYSFNKG